MNNGAIWAFAGPAALVIIVSILCPKSLHHFLNPASLKLHVTRVIKILKHYFKTEKETLVNNSDTKPDPICELSAHYYGLTDLALKYPGKILISPYIINVVFTGPQM